MPDEHAPLTAAEVDAIRARADAATPGPWEWVTDMHWIRTTDEWPHTIAEIAPSPETTEGLSGATVALIVAQAERDGSFLAAARTAVPRLLATLDAYREIARAVAKGAVSSDAGGYWRACLYCSWAVNDYDSEPEHDHGCPVTRARALLGEGTQS